MVQPRTAKPTPRAVVRSRRHEPSREHRRHEPSRKGIAEADQSSGHHTETRSITTAVTSLTRIPTASRRRKLDESIHQPLQENDAGGRLRLFYRQPRGSVNRAFASFERHCERGRARTQRGGVCEHTHTPLLCVGVRVCVFIFLLFVCFFHMYQKISILRPGWSGSEAPNSVTSSVRQSRLPSPPPSPPSPPPIPPTHTRTDTHHTHHTRIHFGSRQVAPFSAGDFLAAPS